MKNSIQILLMALIFNTFSYSQNGEYIDDFGNPLSKIQFRKLKNKGGIKIRLKNKNAKYGMIPIEYRGNISNSIKSKIVHFLELNSDFKIAPNDTIIIEYDMLLIINAMLLTI
ncbi:hypothetical protein [Flavivirga algicola]|uniref:Uncharacterized protein n=1 Tax=Flavivirga algicola TaxID=2729136 RepID=A0ABX1RV50_9FLAO|nr:hypothetical protein [Flavivirga algicola]NMH86230.1 hypothetical protein [Flavivirga algicola]